MTYSEASIVVRTQIRTYQSKASVQISRIDWAKVRSVLYSVAVFVGVVIYLSYLAVRAIIKAVRIAHSLWIEYKVTARIQTAIATLRSEVPTFLAKSRKQVEKVYADFGNRVQQIASSMASDYRSIRNEVRAITKD